MVRRLRHRPGKLLSLLRLLRSHEGAVEADLQRFYGIDYRDRWRGRLSLRRLLVLVEHLPGDSACSATMRDGKPEWRLEHELLDILRMVWTGSKKNPAKPHPLRPRAVRRPDPKRVSEFRRRAAARRQRLQQRG